jgi:hypothetical protein
VVLLGIVFLFVSGGLLDRDRRAAVVEIAPEIRFDELVREVIEKELDSIQIADFQVDDSMIEGLRDLTAVETVIIDQGKVTDHGVDAIATLRDLKHLRLRLSPITDAGLKKLADCQSLWFLNLPHADCTAQGVGYLAALPRLRQLRLGSDQLGNEVCREIAKIGSLRGIHLIGVKVTDEGLKVLANMPHLESLYLDDSAVTEAGWQWLFDTCPQLHVHVDQQHHDRDPKAHPHH